MECYYTRSYLLRSFLILPFTFCLFALSSLQAQTLFVGADGGDWFTATNWNNGLPALGNDATVPSGKTVVISQALNVNFNIQSFGGIKNTAALTLATNLVSGGLITNTGTLTINAGITLTSSGGIINSGTITNNGTCNSNSVFTNAIGSIVNNAGSWNQQAAFTNSGIFNANAGTFTCPQVFTNNAAVNVLASAAFKVDFGGAFTNATGSTLLNAGAFGNLGTFLNTTTVTNTGTFTNNSSHTCNGVFNNESGGTLTTTSTLDINGRINNKVGGTVNNSFNCNVKTAGFFDNAGAFTNANAITISLGGTFCNEATGVVTTNFGSSIVDGGYLKNIAGGQIAGNGSLTTTKKFDNFGLFDAQGGSQITIGDTLNNTGTFKSINIFTNNGYIFSTGSLQNLSGGTWINNKTLVNQKPGVFTNGFEYDNKSGATTTNNGTFINNVRLYNDGDFTNNAYLLAVGDFYNRVGGTLTNTEVVEVNQGSIVNDGTVTNTKSVYLDQCSVLSNRATVNNNGNIISSALIFQRGTVSGNAINKVSGFIQTAAGSAAPICRASLSTGTDLTGAAKVYGQNPVLPNLGIDSCAGFQYFIENTTRKVFTCAQVGTIVTGHFTLLVRTGDSLTCTLPITIFDGVAPIFTNCPSDVTVLSVNNTEKYSWPTITATDNCLGAVSIVSTIASGSSFNLGATNVVVTAKDASNNARDCRFMVTVVQTVPATSVQLTFANCPANISVTVASGAAVATWSEPTVTGSAYPITITKTNGSGSLFGAGVTTVTYTATDANAKVATCIFTVTVTAGDICSNDNINPVIQNCPANIFLVTNPIITSAVAIWKSPTASDNCGNVTLTSNYTSGTIFPIGTQTVVYTATDAKNNTATCTFTINQGAVNPCAGDVTGPTVANCPANITQNVSGLTAPVSWTPPTANDNCSPIITNASAQPGDNFVVGTTPVRYQFSDKVGNLSTCAFNVTLVNACLIDTIAPLLGACPANITVSATGTTAIVTFTNPTATDNCSTPTVIATPASGSSFLVGTTTVTETATDAKGNKSTCTFTVTVTANPCANDIVPPVLGACPANITVNAIVTSALATWTNPTATDNCSTPTVVSAPLPGSSFNVGTTTVTETATDAKGNKSTCTFTVTVIANPCANDIVPPVLSACPANIIVQGAGVGNQAVVTFANPTATDNCSAPSVVSSPLSGSSFNIGTTTVTVTATDAKGNTSKCTFTVTVNAPVNNCTAPPTPKGWISLGSYGNNFYFKYLGGDATLEQAEDLAKKIGGHLPVVHDAAQNSFLKTIATQSIWLGLERDCNGWETPTEAQATYFNWASGEPNNYSGNENAVQMYPSGFWNDISENAYNCTIAELKCAGEPTCQSIKGSILNETWTNISGNLISDLTDNPNYPKNATSQKQLTSFKLAYNEIPNMGNRARGFIYPPQTGNYVFTVYGDDQTDLYLSPDNILGHKKLICNVNSWTNEGELTREANQISQTIYLEGGKEYYIELLNKQGYGGNSFGVLWKLPNTTNSVIVSGNYLAPYYQCTHTPTERCVTDFDAQKLYKIINKNSGKCLDVFSAATTNNASVGQWDYWGGSNQKWSIVATSGGYVKLVAQHSGKVLGCNNNSSTSVLTQNDYVNGGSSEWKIKCADGGYTLTHRASREKCDITNSSTSNGAFAQLFDDNGTDTQIFQIVEVSSGNGNYLQNTKVLTLTAASEANRTRIEWINNTGAVNDFFQVEKMNSSTGAFEKIGAVTSKSTYALENYVSYDMNPTVGDNFYRIAAFYRDGSNNYSEVEKVIFAGLAGNISVYPNPTDEVLNIDLTRYKGASVDVFMYNSIGQIAHAQRIENLLDGILQVDISDKQVGNYCLRIVSKGKRDETKSFIIAR